jgi:hypothetical protein
MSLSASCIFFCYAKGRVVEEAGEGQGEKEKKIKKVRGIPGCEGRGR